MNLINMIIRNVKKAYIYSYIGLFGKIQLKDRFGLRYYLWANTRLLTSLEERSNTDDRGVVEFIYEILPALKAKLEQNLVCLDVGAHIGMMSLAIAKKLSENDKVYCFEPAPRSMKRVQTNVNLNNHKNIFVFNFAVSNKEEKGATFRITKDTGKEFIVSSSLEEDSSGFSPMNLSYKKEEQVDVVTIDNFCTEHQIEQIALLKIDAEFVDHKVLQGAQNLLKNEKVWYIVVEFNQEAQYSQEILKILQENNFDIFYIVRHSKLLVSKLENYPKDVRKPLNILAISQSAPCFVSGEGLPVQDAKK